MSSRERKGAGDLVARTVDALHYNILDERFSTLFRADVMRPKSCDGGWVPQVMRTERAHRQGGDLCCVNLSIMLLWTHGTVESARPIRRGTAKRAKLTKAKASAESLAMSS